ncbi:hypothetical protein Tco_0298347 [Tanacetum coccineum]
MVPDSEKMMEVFIGGLPRRIEGNVTALNLKLSRGSINIRHEAIGLGKQSTLRCKTCTVSVLFATWWGHLTRTADYKGQLTRRSATVIVTGHVWMRKGHYANQCQKDHNTMLEEPTC